MTGKAGTRGEQLDELNRATVRKLHRPIMDDGIGDGDRSALPQLLAELRQNAEQVYGEPKRAPRAS